MYKEVKSNRDSKLLFNLNEVMVWGWLCEMNFNKDSELVEELLNYDNGINIKNKYGKKVVL